MTKKRPHLKAKTTAMLYALAAVGPGGASAERLCGDARMTPRQAGARLRWLQRTGLVRYVHDSRLWQLTDDSMFNKEST